MPKVGIAGFAFGNRGKNPLGGYYPSKTDRIMIARARARDYLTSHLLYLQGEHAYLLTETERQNLQLCVTQHHIDPAQYLDSDSVITQIVDRARKDGIEELRVMAFPFIHGPYCYFVLRREAAKYGIRVRSLSLGLGFTLIGWLCAFDELSYQPWTRGPIQAFGYATYRFLTKKRRGK